MKSDENEGSDEKVEETKKIVESRKLVKWGSSETLIMSLPRSWVKRYQLTKESEVSIMENQDGSLLVSPMSVANEKPRFETSIKFDMAEMDDLELVDLEITTKYMDGFDIIVIEKKDAKGPEKFPTKFTLKVQEVVQSLLGLEIVSLLSNKIKISDIMSIQETSIDVLVKIIADTTIDFFQTMIDLFKTREISTSLESMSLSKKQVRKYYLRVLRELRKGLLVPASLARMGLSAQDVVDLAFFITDTNEVSEILDFIINSMKNQAFDPAISAIINDLVQFMGEVSMIFKQAVDSFLFKKKKDAIDVIKQVPKHETNKRTLENKLDETSDSSHKYVHFQIILDLLSKILDHSESISKSALRRII
jgi:phosphate uptake regulator